VARELDPASAFRELVEEATLSPPGAKGLVMLPYFSGERTPIHDPNAKGVIFGLDLTHGRGDLYRALLEGIAFGTHHIFQTHDEAGETPHLIFAVGGGTKNKVWAQATSDISGKTQIVRQKTVGASYGDAFLAAYAVGDVKIDAIRDWNPVEYEFNPRREYATLYKDKFKIFRELYVRNSDLMR
jgi:xylulokinase